jgi:hypothetical protein
MQASDIRTLLRVAIVAIITVGLWAIVRHHNGMPAPLGANAPASQFSAARADATLGRVLGPEVPHPAGTQANAEVRGRVLAEYAALGVPTKTYRAIGCFMGKRYGALTCATVTDIIAEVRPGAGKAIVMLSHYDSVPAGPGAADDGSGTATVLEATRALKQTGDDGIHPILAVNTDGEEFGLLGAASFLDNPELKARVGGVLNFEARGDAGPSTLFQMSAGNAPLLEVYAKNAPEYSTTSLTDVIYKYLPNDTDLTLFINDGFLSWNFAMIDHLPHYHTPRDTRANLDKSTLQMHGDSLLAMVRGLQKTRFEDLKGGDAIYISMFGRLLPRMPAGWALPLSGLVTLLLLVTFFVRGNGGEGRWRAFAILPLLIVGCVLVGFAMQIFASLVAGQPDPSNAFPMLLRASLALGTAAIAVLVGRLSDAKPAAMATAIWMAVFAIVTSALLTGLSPYFLFPLLIATPLLLIASFAGIDFRSSAGQLILLLAAIPMLLIWLSLLVTGEMINGLLVHELFTVPAAFVLAAVVPSLAARDLSRGTWASLVAILLVGSAGLAAAQGLQPTFSETSPQRLDISYIEDGTTNRTVWAANASQSLLAPLPEALRKVMSFSAKPVETLSFGYGTMAYVSPAGAPRFALPTADVRVTDVGGGVRRVAVTLHASGLTNQVVLAVPHDAGLKSVDIDGKHNVVPDTWAQLTTPYNVIACSTSDCATKTITFDITSRSALKLPFAEVRYGLPAGGEKLQAARGETAVASHGGDTTVLVNSVMVPKS